MKKIISTSAFLLLQSFLSIVITNSSVIALSAQNSNAEGTKTLVDPRDGKTYKIVQVGTQWWMAENLNYSTSGSFVSGSKKQSNNDSIDKYCLSDKKVNCDTYGGLYQWAEAIQYFDGASNKTFKQLSPTIIIQGVCPTGWHIPTNKEWRTMLESEGTIQESWSGVKLNMNAASWKNPDESYENSFKSLTGGMRDFVGSYSDADGRYGYWWTTSETNASESWGYMLNSMEARVHYQRHFKACGLSVRCVKD